MGEIKFKFLDHTADIKFKAYGKDLNELFENAGLCVFSTMYAGRVFSRRKLKIRAKGKDLNNLLYNFLEELLVLLDSKNFFVSSLKVKVDLKKLSVSADVSGDDASKYEIGLDVKAITYNDMFVKHLGKKWVCQVVVDV